MVKGFIDLVQNTPQPPQFNNRPPEAFSNSDDSFSSLLDARTISMERLESPPAENVRMDHRPEPSEIENSRIREEQRQMKHEPAETEASREDTVSKAENRPVSRENGSRPEDPEHSAAVENTVRDDDPGKSAAAGGDTAETQIKVRLDRQNADGSRVRKRGDGRLTDRLRAEVNDLRSEENVAEESETADAEKILTSLTPEEKEHAGRNVRSSELKEKPVQIGQNSAGSAEDRYRPAVRDRMARDDRPVVSVIDNRTERLAGAGQESGHGSSSRHRYDRQSGGSGAGEGSGSVENGSRNYREQVFMIQDADSPSAAETLRGQAGQIRNAGSLFEKFLKARGNAEITRNVSFILKNDNAGEIRLILKPESLGNVRIRLNLAENNITGRIIVENNTVKQVFLDNLQEISRLLEEQGYDTAGLEVTVDDRGQQNGQEGNGQQPFFSSRLRELDQAVPAAEGYGADVRTLDMIA
jgi:flagellar hook-length control protein FliK